MGKRTLDQTNPSHQFLREGPSAELCQELEDPDAGRKGLPAPRLRLAPGGPGSFPTLRVKFGAEKAATNSRGKGGRPPKTGGWAVGGWVANRKL